MFPNGKNWTYGIVSGNIKTIPSGIFNGSTLMNKLEITAPVEVIEDYAFEHMDSLTYFNVLRY